MPVKPLERGKNAYIPKALAKQVGVVIQEDAATERIRAIKSLLNKLTLERFDAIAEQIAKVGIPDDEALASVIDLIYEKALDETHFASMYARLCQYLVENLSRFEPWIEATLTRNQVRRAMVLRCQNQFYNDEKIADTAELEEELRQARQNIDELTAEQKEAFVKRQEDVFKAKRRVLGNVRFVGEIFAMGLLSARIVLRCATQIYDKVKVTPDDGEMETLCNLLTRAGPTLETTTMPNPNATQPNAPSILCSDLLNKMFQDLAPLAQDKRFSSRIRFMLMDLFELRKKNWQGVKDAGPKTIAQIRAQIEIDKAKALAASQHSSGGHGGRHGGDRHGGDRHGGGSRTPSVMTRAGALHNFGALTSGDRSSILSGKKTSWKKAPAGGGAPSSIERTSSYGSSHHMARTASATSTSSVISNNAFSPLADEPATASSSASAKETPAALAAAPVKLSVATAEKRVVHLLKEYSSNKNIEEAKQSYLDARTALSHAACLALWIKKVLEAKTQDAVQLAELVGKLIEEKTLDPAALFEGLQQGTDEYAELLTDAPKMPDVLGAFLGTLAAHDHLALGNPALRTTALGHLNEEMAYGLFHVADIMRGALHAVVQTLQLDQAGFYAWVDRQKPAFDVKAFFGDDLAAPRTVKYLETYDAKLPFPLLKRA